MDLMRNFGSLLDARFDLSTVYLTALTEVVSRQHCLTVFKVARYSDVVLPHGIAHFSRHWYMSAK